MDVTISSSLTTNAITSNFTYQIIKCLNPTFGYEEYTIICTIM
jgi:hypothetical protein